MQVPRDIERKLVNRWREAGPALSDVRRRDLRTITEAQALEAVLALLDLVPHLPPKSGGSGLVEQQKIFARATAR
ncbi:MAG: hypothetical protein ACRDRS_15920 [Pseudonocardiaceae bacterium]